MKTKTALILSSSALLSLSCFAVPSGARAQERVEGDWQQRREEAALYPLEIEPHFSFGAENVYGATGAGAGLRVSIPLAYGHVGRVPDNVAISFGGDVLHYDNCYYADNCGANYVLLPVAAQWNLQVLRRVSVFLEGGVFVYKGWFDGCRETDGPGCNQPSDFGVLPTLAIGGRIHIGDNVSFTMRLGYPTTTLGLSFL